MECVRFSFLSHSELLSLSIEPVMANHRDLILQGLSIRLNIYESAPNKPSLIINMKPRKYIEEPEKPVSIGNTNERYARDSIIKINESKEINPLFSLDKDNVNYKDSAKSGFVQHTDHSNKRQSIEQNQMLQSYPNYKNPRPPQSNK